MHEHMPIDKALMILALSAYVVSALALIVYFFARDAWLRNLGVPLAIAGCIAQFAQLAARYELTHVWPLLNLYGSLSLFSALAVAIYIGFAFRYRLWFIGGFVIAMAALFLAYGVTWDEGTMPAVPSLQSYWAKIHVPLVVSSYAAFMVAFIVSALYLMKYYYENALEPAAEYAVEGGSLRAQRASVRLDTPNIAAAAAAGNPVAQWINAMPTLAQLDVLIYRIVAVGLPLLTLGVITGAMWAHDAWGAYWQWDPKETAALVSWIVYAVYMHLHTRNAWRGLRSAWVSVIGFLTIMFCYFGVNIWISGLHSYKV